MIGGEKIEQPELAQHDASVLDLAFVMDCTGSMGSYIANATESIRKIFEEIVGMEKSDVKLALVEYRDHPPQETTFVTRAHDFTSSVSTMRGWLEECSAQGGGDEPEAVADGLNDALNLDWREKSTKICVLISDAPPHGIGSRSDTMPNGCPKGIDPIKVVDKMAKKGITLYTVGCEPSILPYKDFFAGIAFKTGGQYVPLRNAKLLAKVIVGGAVEEISLDRLMEEAANEVSQLRAKGIVDEKELAEAVQSSFSKRGKMTRGNLAGASERAKEYSRVADLEELRAQYKPDFTAAEGAALPGGASAAYGRAMYMTASAAHPAVNLASDGPRGAGGSHSEVIRPSAPREESYGIAQNSEIDISQSERLVKRILNRETS